jgi:hypothetical protein
LKVLKIDEEFKNLISPPVPDETKQLEENIIKEGCRDSLVTWNGILIDGHNRYTICTKHNIPFKTVEMYFETREDVIDWIVDNQLGRRNITDVGRSDRNFGAEKSSTPKTSEILGEQHKVSEKTIREDGLFAEAVDKIGESIGETIKQDILTKKIKLPKREIINVSKLPKHLQKKAITGELVETKTCTKCNTTKSIHDFYKDGSYYRNSCKECYNNAVRPLKDVCGNVLKTDSDLLNGIDLDELINKVKDTNKSAANTDFKTRVAMLKSSTENFLCNADLFFQFCDSLEKTEQGKEDLLEVIITLEDVIHKIKNII